MVGRTQPGAGFAARTGTAPNPARINFHSAAEHPQNVTGVTGVNEFSRAVGVGFLMVTVHTPHSGHTRRSLSGSGGEPGDYLHEIDAPSHHLGDDQ